jgi:hypothetical protein
MHRLMPHHAIQGANFSREEPVTCPRVRDKWGEENVGLQRVTIRPYIILTRRRRFRLIYSGLFDCDCIHLDLSFEGLFQG